MNRFSPLKAFTFLALFVALSAGIYIPIRQLAETPENSPDIRWKPETGLSKESPVSPLHPDQTVSTPDRGQHQSLQLFQPPRYPSGTRLEPNASQFLSASTASAVSGRSAVLERTSFARLQDLRAGEAIDVPLMDGRIVSGRVILVKADESSWTRVGGELEDGLGSFSLRSNGRVISGLVLLKREHLAYEIEEQKDGRLWMLEKRSPQVVCDPLPREPEEMARSPRSEAAEAVPILNSRPGSANVIYLDFDGETVTDPDWNGGATIVAPSFNLSNATINSIFDRVKEDWIPFDVNVTTDVTNYDGAAVGHRMRVIITPNDAAAPGAGGVAYLTSFRNAGTSFSTTIPCWVFNSSIVGISEAISHEVGHTMGLSHDGQDNVPGTGHVEYYLGQGSGATGWCPIMGAGYYKSIVQWSKGEYQYADNNEDDLAIISAKYNHLGYVVDDAGNSRASAGALSGNPSTGAVSQSGLIERTGDADFYTFFTNGGALSITASDPSSSPDLDLVLEIQDAAGNVLNIPNNPNNPVGALTASISTNLPVAGQYYLKVSPTGANDPFTTGYSNYGSLGQYVLKGTIQGLTQNPIITSATTASGQVGGLFGYQIKAIGNPASFGLRSPNDTLPLGLVLDANTGSITGYPTQAGTYLITVTATNASGTGSRDVTISIADAALTIGEAVDFPSLVWTTSAGAPWVGQKSVTKVDGDAVQAAQIGDGKETSFGTTVSGPVTLDFWWKVSSEQDGDFLLLQIDGVDVPNVTISGVVDWTAVSVPIAAGQHAVAWVYRKNAGISQDPDTAWVDGVAFSSTDKPVVSSSGSAGGVVGVPFSYQVTATNVPWSFAISGGSLPLGLSFDSETGLISGAAAVAGNSSLQITASNNIGVSDALTLQIQITPSPVSVSEALDDVTTGAYTLTSIPSGLPNWFPESGVTHDQVDALQSGPIGPGQTVQFTKTVSGINTVNFWWRVESLPSTGGGSNFQGVRFYVDGGAAKASLTGVTDWTNESVYIGGGTHTLTWSYERDNSGTLGADAAWVDQVVLTSDILPVVTNSPPTGKQGVPYSYQIQASNSPTSFSATGFPDGLVLDSSSGIISGVPTISGKFDVVVGAMNRAGTGTKLVSQLTFDPAPADLGVGVDATQLTWTTSPSKPWFVQTAVSFDGVDAAQSSPIGANSSSYIETQVTGPTIVSFRWSVESEQAHDFLSFSIDSTLQAQISGPKVTSSQPWDLRSFALEAGTHTLRWTYTKNATVSFGRDAAWLDMVTIDSSTTKPKITSPLAVTAYIGRPFSYQIKGTNGPNLFAASSLPNGLTLDTATGIISGSPLAAATTNVSLSASNTGATGFGPASTLAVTAIAETLGADQLANATALSGAAVLVESDNSFATAEANEPAHAGQAAQSSIWYSWLAPLSGAATVTTAGSVIDTLLSVYEVPVNVPATFANIMPPNRASGLPRENDDAGKFITSSVKFNATAGHRYLIAVDSLNKVTGKIVLNITYIGAGLYSGLLLDNAHVASPGLATITLTSKFSFSGAILLGGKKIALKPLAPNRAVFTGEDFSGQISRGKGISPAQLNLHIDLSPGAEEITGTVVADGVTYGLFASLGIGKGDVPTSLPGPFTFLIEPDDTTTAGLPRGIGYGTVTIDKAGGVKVAGTLGDGTKFGSGSHLALDKSWILYSNPYKTGGVVAGNVTVKQVNTQGGGGTVVVKSLSSNVSWQKGFDASPTFNTTGTVRGFQHIPTNPLLTLSGAAATKIAVTFVGSDLNPKPADFTGTLDTRLTLTGGANFKVKFVTKTGLFSGSLPNPNGGKAHAFGGAVLNGVEFVSDSSGAVTQQPVSRGAGTFSGVGKTGAIGLKPIP